MCEHRFEGSCFGLWDEETGKHYETLICKYCGYKVIDRESEEGEW